MAQLTALQVKLIKIVPNKTRKKLKPILRDIGLECLAINSILLSPCGCSSITSISSPQLPDIQFSHCWTSSKVSSSIPGNNGRPISGGEAKGKIKL